MREPNTVGSSEEGKIRLRQAMRERKLSEYGEIKYKEALEKGEFTQNNSGNKLTQEQLAKLANVSLDTVKRLLGTKDKDYPNRVERWAVENIVKVLGMEPTDIVAEKDWYPQQQLPSEFKALLEEKTQIFCGRKFVFSAFEEFIKNNQKGYFTVVGDAGMGKSAIAAKYVLDNPETICFFNIRAEGMNRPELFLKKIRQQLIARFQLQNLDDGDLSTLLTKVKEKLSPGERLIIVVDALDEVDQDGTANILYLPTIIPDGVYFLLTRRPYNQNEKRLNLSPSIPTKELDLREKIQESVQDVKEYIRELLTDGKYQQGLAQWIQQQNHISHDDFVETIAVKSENNFMYLRCILPAIADGFYKDKPLDELPVGLEGYYENHWQIMGMTAKPLPKNKIKIVYVMCALRSAASREVIAKYSKQNALTVQEVMDGWAQFLQKQESYQPPRYRFYHESFRDFLHRRDIVQAAGVNLPDISTEVAKNMTEGLIL